MKQIFILLLTLSFFSNLNAQNAIDQHFSQFADDANTTNISVTGKMFEMISSINIESDTDQKEIDEMKDFFGSITSFRLIAGEEVSNAKSQYVYGDEKLASTHEELVRVNDKEGKFALYIDEEDGIVHEVVGLGWGEDNLMVFSLMGALRLDQVGKIVEHIDDSGFSQLSKVKDFNATDVKVFPNPVSSSTFTLETPKDFDGSIATLYDSNGSMVRTYKINQVKQVLDIDGLVEGNYIISVEQGGISVKKKLIILN